MIKHLEHQSEPNTDKMKWVLFFIHDYGFWICACSPPFSSYSLLFLFFLPSSLMHLWIRHISFNFFQSAGVKPSKPTLPVGRYWFTLLAVQASNLNSELPTQAHQLRYLASRTSISDTITWYRKTSILLKLSNVTFAEFFTSPAKM